MTKPQPAFVTLTGVDRLTHVQDITQIARAFADRVEFGVLIAPEKFGTPRFPDMRTIDALRHAGLRLSAHVCGAFAEQVFAGADIEFDLAGFTRTQINLVGRHATPDEIENAVLFGQNRGIRTILQCGAHYPDDPRCDWLLDNSYGTGQRLTGIPTMAETGAFCGISGGLSQGTINEILADAAPQIGTRPFWIDAESALIRAGEFSPTACTEFLETVFHQNKGEKL